MNKGREYLFYQWSVADIERHFLVKKDEGLTQKQAQLLLQKNGANSFETLHEQSPWVIFFRQFANFFVGLLFAAAVISYFVDGLAQTGVLLAIIVFNILLGFFQEYKAEQSLSKLKNTLSQSCRVFREGKLQKIESTQLVQGDIVLLEAGDKVPADLRIIEEESLQIDESALTGESLPVSKVTKVLPIDTPLGDRKNMAFCSTVVVAGHGKGIVTGVGRNTEFGQVAKLISLQEDATPLEKQVTYLGKNLTYIAFALSLIIFLLGYWRGFDLLNLLTFTIALLIAVVPESLPTAITLSLAVGVMRMAKKKAIVRRLAVVETLGTTNIIATDKTGTLTDNKLSVDSLYLYQNKHFEQISSQAKTEDKKSLEFLNFGLACSNLDLAAKELISDPIEAAIVEAADRLDQLENFKQAQFKRTWEIPFDSDKKYMAVSVQNASGNMLIAKGAPEKILELCSLSQKEYSVIETEAIRLSGLGFKVIALAAKETKLAQNSLTDLNFIGFIAIIDQPSAGIKEAIKKTLQAGIRTIILTGDHPETARFVANRIGLSVSPDEIITKTDLEQLNKRELRQVLDRVKIFARVTPEDKINLVKTLQDLGYSVAMTGDGVNDAPALKEAEAGIAMGIRGTDVAKESSDIVLSDDRYATIISAVEYGRAIYDNIKNVVVQLISGNFNEIFLVFFAFMFGLPLPFITIQILWINLIIESLASLSFSFEEPSRSVLQEKPRPVGANSLNSSIKYSVSLALVSFVFGLIIYLWSLTYSVALARTMVFCFVVLSELSFSFSIRSKKRIWQDPKSFIENKYLLFAALIALVLQSCLFIEPFARIFGLVSLGFTKTLIVLVMAILMFFTAEIIRHYYDKKPRS